MSNKKNIMVIECPGTENENHAYNIKVKQGKDSRTYKINRSNDSNWTSHVRGENIGSLKDHGNGVKLSIGDIQDINLEYHEVYELKTLLDFYEKNETNFGCEREFYDKTPI